MTAKKKVSPRKSAKAETNILKGWTAIAEFLKIPGATVQRWAKSVNAGEARRTIHRG